MSWNAPALYDLLPSVHRVRDAEQGYPLRQFLAVLAEQARVLEEDVEQLYDNGFVETCADWVLPYIGDLVGYRTIHGAGTVANRRAEIANTIALRRRKGTVVMLEQLARDVTGWVAHAKEFFQILATNQHMDHARLFNRRSPDLRHWEPLERLNGAFDTIAHHPEVGRIPIGEGRHNIRNIGLFLWRLTAYPIRGATAAPLAGDPRRWFFSPLGANCQLFNPPVPETEIASLAGPLNVPEPIGRRRLAAFIGDYYPRALRIVADGVEVPVANVRGCNLADAGGGAWAHAPQNVVAIDPVLGRINFPPNLPAPRSVIVDFHYGFCADLGGGNYERADSFLADLGPVRQVAAGAALQLELDQVEAGGIVEISDSLTYAGAVAINPDPGRRIELRADNGQRPLVSLPGDLVITGGDGSEVTLNGLVVSGGAIRIPAAGNALRMLRLRHCTIVPGRSLNADGSPAQPAAPALVIEQRDVTVEIERCILGAIHAHPSVQLSIIDSIVDANAPENVAFAGPAGTGEGPVLRAIATTFVGKVHAAAMMLVSNSIFSSALAAGDAWTAPVRAERRQIGCVRFSFVPSGSRAPRRYRCQPSLAIAEAQNARKQINPLVSQPELDAIAMAAIDRVVPSWTSLRYGDPGYGQLLHAAPREIRTGADDESEMGMTHLLFQPQREANLRIRLDEYLGVGLEAGLIFET
ncbi:hypothetical protein PX699_22200 [Sphingobium sp. H39-3-25]|uniref:hypothetical protein n=1 Tax=Sphingobium arseniciresistens TaxID=3030834 RepID=UPI0023BA0FFC|nr:hypothetical protein [Sphingobium arseniciresistens]